MSMRDNVRVERMQQCMALRELLRQCRDNKEDRPRLEDIPMGIRSVRYFQWRDYQPEGHSCAREEHAVYGCLAVCLKCGSEMVEVRNCLEEYGTINTLSHGKTFYEAGQNPGISDEEGFPCIDVQRKLGNCVRENMRQLEERININTQNKK